MDIPISLTIATLFVYKYSLKIASFAITLTLSDNKKLRLHAGFEVFQDAVEVLFGGSWLGVGCSLSRFAERFLLAE